VGKERGRKDGRRRTQPLTFRETSVQKNKEEEGGRRKKVEGEKRLTGCSGGEANARILSLASVRDRKKTDALSVNDACAKPVFPHGEGVRLRIDGQVEEGFGEGTEREIQSKKACRNEKTSL